MDANRTPLLNGQMWTADDFDRHYVEGSGEPVGISMD